MKAVRTRRRVTAGDIAWAVTSLVYLAFVLMLTLAPTPWATLGAQVPFGVLNPSTWLDRATWTAGSPFEFALNVIMFVPAGLLATRLGRRCGIAGPLLLTTAIEVVQIALPDRISDPRDLVANTVGALIGILLATGSRRFPRTQGLGDGMAARAEG